MCKVGSGRVGTGLREVPKSAKWHPRLSGSYGFLGRDCPSVETMCSFTGSYTVLVPRYWTLREWTVQHYGNARYMPFAVLVSRVPCLTKTFFHHVAAQQVAQQTLRTFAVYGFAIFITVTALATLIRYTVCLPNVRGSGNIHRKKPLLRGHKSWQPFGSASVPPSRRATDNIMQCVLPGLGRCLREAIAY